MLSWIEWVLERTNYRYYDQFLEEVSEEEKEKLQEEYDEYLLDCECLDFEDDDEEYVPSSTNGDYSPSNPWDAPGMTIWDFI